MKAVRITLLVIAIGLGIIAVSVIRNPLRRLQQENYKVEVNPYSVVFYAKSFGQPSFKISPLDDYYYFGSDREHVVNDSSLLYFTRDFTQEFLQILKRIVNGNKSIVWSAKMGEVTLNYKAQGQGNSSILVSREIKNPGREITAFGQIINFCEYCIVTDQDGRVYLTYNFVNDPENKDYLEGLDVAPTLIDSQLPLGNSKILILGSQGEKRAEIEIMPDQEIYLDQKWHLLEFKSPTRENKTIVASQVIKF